MIAELDPVVIFVLGTNDEIHDCIQHYSPTSYSSGLTLQQGMNTFDIIIITPPGINTGGHPGIPPPPKIPKYYTNTYCRV